MASRQSDSDITIIKFLRQPIHDFSKEFSFKGRLPGKSKSLLTAPAQQHRPGGKSELWFNINLRGSKLGSVQVEFNPLLETFERAMKDYPVIRKSHLEQLSRRSVTFRRPRSEQDVIQAFQAQILHMLYTFITAEHLRTPEAHQWFPIPSSMDMTRNTELKLLNLMLETPAEAGSSTLDSNDDDAKSSKIRVDLIFVLSARVVEGPETRGRAAAASDSIPIGDDNVEKTYLPPGTFWSVKDVKEFSKGADGAKSESLKALLPVEFKRFGSLRLALFEVLSFGKGLVLSDFDKQTDSTLAKRITAFETNKPLALIQFGDMASKVKALRGTVSMIQQAVRYAQGYHTDTTVLCDYASCVVIKLPPRSSGPGKPAKYDDDSILQWYFSSCVPMGDNDTDFDPKRTIALVLAVELWRAIETFTGELEEYTGSDGLARRMKNFSI